jgi:hypothetical protein
MNRGESHQTIIKTIIERWLSRWIALVVYVIQVRLWDKTGKKLGIICGVSLNNKRN